MKAARPFGAVLLSLALVAGACTGDSGGGATSTSDGNVTTTARVTTTTVPEVVTFRVGLVDNITTDNWWAALDTEDHPQNKVFLTNGKVSMFSLSLPGFVYVPGIAATDTPVAPVPDGDIWYVEQPIRADLTWSDGEPVSADDFVFYYDTIKEFELGGEHASYFGPTVTSVTAPDEHTVRVEFSEDPGLAGWNNSVALAPFVPSHFWRDSVDAARAAADAVLSGTTDEEAVAAIVDRSLENENPDDDIAPGDVTPEDIDRYVRQAAREAAMSSLYGVSGIGEPSVGPVIVDRWERGSFARSVANPDFFDTGTEKTLYSDGSFRIANSNRSEDNVYGGTGSGAVLADYLEGPFVDEIVWVEHDSREAAYEDLARGDVDYVYDPDGATSDLKAELAEVNPDLQFNVNQAGGYRYMAFNMRKAPMSDLAFRRALATVINKEMLADAALDEAVFPAYTIIHPDLVVFYDGDVERPGWRDGEPLPQGDRFDSAIQILKAAGYSWDSEPQVQRAPDGAFIDVTPGEGLTMPNGQALPGLTMLAPARSEDPFRATVSEWITKWMNQLGIPVTLEPTSFEAIVDTAFPPQTPDSALEWDIYMLGWGDPDVASPGTAMRGVFDSDQEAVEFGGFNTTGYKSDEFDAVAEEFDSATNIEAAARTTKQMDAIIARDLPYVVLFRIPVIEAYADSVRFPVDRIMGGAVGYANAWPGAVTISRTGQQ